MFVFRYAAIPTGMVGGPAMAYANLLASGQLGMSPDFSAQGSFLG